MAAHSDESIPSLAAYHAEEAERHLVKSKSAPIDALRTQFATQSAAHATLALYYQGSSS